MDFDPDSLDFDPDCLDFDPDDLEFLDLKDFDPVGFASSSESSVSVSTTVSRIETATTPRNKSTPYPKRPKHCQKVTMLSTDGKICGFQNINPEHYLDPLDEWRKGVRDRREWKFEGKLKLLSDQQFQNFSKKNRDWFLDESEERAAKRKKFADKSIRQRMNKYGIMDIALVFAIAVVGIVWERC